MPSSGGPSFGKRRRGSPVVGSARRCSSSCWASIVVDLQPRGERGEAHAERRLGHPVGGDHRLRLQAEAATRRSERRHGVRVDGLGAVERDAERRQVERPLVGAGELPAEHRVGEVRRRGDRAAVLRDQLGPQQRAGEEVDRGDAHELEPRGHRDRQEPDHAHVVEQREPGHHHVAPHVERGGVDHAGDVGVQVAMGDPHRFRLRRGAARQLQEGGVVLAGCRGVGDEVVAARVERLDGAVGDAALGEHRPQPVERRTEQHELRVDHP